MNGDVEINWGDDAILVSTDGVTCHASHCGCSTQTLDSRSQILSLYHALGDWLVANPSPVEETHP